MVSVCRDLAIVLAAEGEFIAAWQHVEAVERLGGGTLRGLSAATLGSASVAALTSRGNPRR